MTGITKFGKKKLLQTVTDITKWDVDVTSWIKLYLMILFCITIIRTLVANTCYLEFLKVYLSIDTDILWKSENPVFITNVLGKDVGVLVNIRSIQLDLSGSLKLSRIFIRCVRL